MIFTLCYNIIVIENMAYTTDTEDASELKKEYNNKAIWFKGLIISNVYTDIISLFPCTTSNNLT